MTEPIAGEKESEPSLKKLEAIESILNEYEKCLIGEASASQEYEKFLSLNRSQIEALSAEECFFGSYTLAQQMLFVQRKINREQARMKWCSNVTNYLVASKWGEYSDFIKADIKIALISKNDDILEKVSKIKNAAEQRVERFMGIIGNIKYISDVLLEIGKTKRWNNKNEH